MASESEREAERLEPRRRDGGTVWPYQICKSTRDELLGILPTDRLLRTMTDGLLRRMEGCGRCAVCVLRADGGYLLFFIFLVLAGLGKRRCRFVIVSPSEWKERGGEPPGMWSKRWLAFCKRCCANHARPLVTLSAQLRPASRLLPIGTSLSFLLSQSRLFHCSCSLSWVGLACEYLFFDSL